MRKIVTIVLFIVLITTKPCTGKAIDSLAGNIKILPGNFFSKIEKKYSSIEKKLSGKTSKCLVKMQRQEKKKAAKIDSGYIPHQNVDSIYCGQSPVVHLNRYNAYLDTLSTSLTFLQKYKGLEDKIRGEKNFYK